MMDDIQDNGTIAVVGDYDQRIQAAASALGTSVQDVKAAMQSILKAFTISNRQIKAMAEALSDWAEIYISPDFDFHAYDHIRAIHTDLCRHLHPCKDHRRFFIRMAGYSKSGFIGRTAKRRKGRE